MSVLICRGCCCGTDKHDVDHVGHEQALRDALPQAARLYVTDCLGPCERSNVVVVRTGSVRRWFGEVLDDDVVGALCDWVAAGAAAPPTELVAHQFEPAVDRPPTAVRIEVAGDDLADLVEALLRDPQVGWAMGVDGAAAELRAGDASIIVERRGRSVSMSTADVGVGIDVSDGAAGFVVRGPDGAPAVLLLAVPDGAEAAPVEAACIRTTVGQAEVRAGASSGSIVIDPGRLELGRPLPEQAALPPGWTLGAAAWLIEADQRTRERVAAG